MLHAEEDAGESDVSLHGKHGTMSVAAGGQDGQLVAIDHWEVDHRAHEAGAEHIPESDSQKEKSDLYHDVPLFACLCFQASSVSRMRRKT